MGDNIGISVVNNRSKLWYEMLDDNEGKPYKGMKPDKIERVNIADVADLKNAVKDKNADGVLKDVSAGQLKVYLNKDAFIRGDELAGSAVVDDNMGSTEGNALVVVAPNTSNGNAVNYFLNGLFITEEHIYNFKRFFLVSPSLASFIPSTWLSKEASIYKKTGKKDSTSSSDSSILSKNSSLQSSPGTSGGLRHRKG